MIERVSLSVVWGWCLREFVEHGYRFEIKMTSFGDQRFPVIHVYDNSRAITPFMFNIVLDDGYTKKNPESDDWDFGDRVNVDFQLFYNSFHDEMKKFWVEHSRYNAKYAELQRKAEQIYAENKEMFDRLREAHNGISG